MLAPLLFELLLDALQILLQLTVSLPFLVELALELLNLPPQRLDLGLKRLHLLTVVLPGAKRVRHRVHFGCALARAREVWVSRGSARAAILGRRGGRCTGGEARRLGG